MSLTNINISECSFDELLKLENILKDKIRKNKKLKNLQIELCYIQNELELRKKMRRKIKINK